MNEKLFETSYGTIHYWIQSVPNAKQTLVFLPGLTTTHQLFEKQIAYFQDKYNLFVWDAPGHGASRPFDFKFSMDDQARYPHDILEIEKIIQPILIGQSIGGYIAQMYMELYPGKTGGFISIDSSSLKRKMVNRLDIFKLNPATQLYKLLKWEQLIKIAESCAESVYGKKLMNQMMQQFDKDSYGKLAGHCAKIFAQALSSNRQFNVDCPALLLCGTKDNDGPAKKANLKWSKATGIPLIWIEVAGHNSNTDKPDEVNHIIENFVKRL